MQSSYQGKPFTVSELTFSKLNFSDSYRKTVILFEKKTFVKVYSADGTFTERTFAEFNADVLKVFNTFIFEHPENSIIVTKSDNNYWHLCYIMAVLVSGRRLCLLNPNESADDTEKKLKLLAEPYTVLPIAEPVLSSNKNEIGKNERKYEDDFIYVFTSGTTGNPKIVRQTEASTLANIEAMVRHHQLLDGDKIIATPLPIFHVNALHFSFFSTFFSGSKLILFQKFDPLLLIRSVAEDKINIISLVPHILAPLLNFESKLHKANAGHFQYFVSAATGLPHSLLLKWLDLGYKIIQGYGMSEGINFSLKTPIHLSIDQIHELSKKYIIPTVGVPVWGCQVEVFSSSGVRVDDGVQGELGFRGFNLMPGYKNQGAALVNSENYFLTGDLGFVHTFNGQRYFFVTSRIKEIAKPMGEMVSLPSLDEKIRKLIGHHVEVMTFQIEDSNNGERIGLVIGQNYDESQAAQLTNLLLGGLQTYERPLIVCMTLNNLRSPSGKLLRGKGKSYCGGGTIKIIRGIEWRFPQAI